MPAATADHQADDARLALGEQYAVTAKRGPVSQRYAGSLLLANPEWIVLRDVSEARNEQSTPVVGLIPYVQRWFRNVSIGRVSEYVWIPRSAASNFERLTTVIQAAAHEAPPSAAPSIGVECSVELAEGSQIASRQGKLAKLAGGKLTLACQNLETRERPRTGAARIPVFGAFLTTEELVAKTTLEVHSLDKVLSIRVPFGFPEDSK
jgi:hypothetical protein